MPIFSGAPYAYVPNGSFCAFPPPSSWQPTSLLICFFPNTLNTHGAVADDQKNGIEHILLCQSHLAILVPTLPL
jgi:hypothetical protein